MDNLRRFFLTVSIIIFVALCIGGFITALKFDPKEVQLVQTEPTPLTAVGGVYNPEEFKAEEIFDDNVLFIISPKKDSSAVNFLLSKYDSKTGTLNFLIIPNELKVVDSKNNVCTLGALYKSNKGKAVASYLTSLFEIKVDKYCAFNYDELSSFLKEFGDVTVNIPYNLKYISVESDDTNYSTGFNFKKGDITLNVDSTINLLKFTNDSSAVLDGSIVNYYDGIYKNTTANQIHSFVTDDFMYFYLKGFVNKFKADNQEKINNSFKKFSETKDNNLNEDVIKGLTAKLGDIKKDNINFYQLTGDYQENNNLYFLFNGEIKNLKSNEIKPMNEIISFAFS